MKARTSKSNRYIHIYPSIDGGFCGSIHVRGAVKGLEVRVGTNIMGSNYRYPTRKAMRAALEELAAKYGI